MNHEITCNRQKVALEYSVFKWGKIINEASIVGVKTDPGESSSSNITVSTSSAWIAVLISATLPDPMYVLEFGVESLIIWQVNKLSEMVHHIEITGWTV